jgi:hypothetical protein
VCVPRPRRFIRLQGAAHDDSVGAASARSATRIGIQCDEHVRPARGNGAPLTHEPHRCALVRGSSTRAREFTIRRSRRFAFNDARVASRAIRIDACPALGLNLSANFSSFATRRIAFNELRVAVCKLHRYLHAHRSSAPIHTFQARQPPAPRSMKRTPPRARILSMHDRTPLVCAIP